MQGACFVKGESMKVILHNCQGITDCTLDLPPNSLVEFTGDNSNGKSTVSRYIEHIVAGDLHLKEERLPLIKDGCEKAEFGLIADNNSMLIVILYREVGKSYMCYFPDADNTSKGISRLISDRDACAKLVSKFGFCVYAKGEICLNIGPTFGPIPLVTTKSKTNFEVLDDFTKDATAEEFIKSYTTYTRPMFNRKMKSLKERRADLERLTEQDLYPDWEFCKSFAERNKDLATALASLVVMQHIDYGRPPVLNVVDMKRINYSRPCFFEFKHAADLSSQLRTIVEFNNKKCPTCGRLYMEEE